MVAVMLRFALVLWFVVMSRFAVALLFTITL